MNEREMLEWLFSLSKSQRNSVFQRVTTITKATRGELSRMEALVLVRQSMRGHSAEVMAYARG